MNSSNGQIRTPSPPILSNGPNHCIPGSHPSVTGGNSGNPLMLGPNIHQMQQLLQQQLLTPFMQIQQQVSRRK